MIKEFRGLCENTIKGLTVLLTEEGSKNSDVIYDFLDSLRRYGWRPWPRKSWPWGHQQPSNRSSCRSQIQIKSSEKLARFDNLKYFFCIKNDLAFKIFLHEFDSLQDFRLTRFLGWRLFLPITTQWSRNQSYNILIFSHDNLQNISILQML